MTSRPLPSTKASRRPTTPSRPTGSSIRRPISKTGQLDWDVPEGKGTIVPLRPYQHRSGKPSRPRSGPRPGMRQAQREATEARSRADGKLVADAGRWRARRSYHAHRQLGNRLAELDAPVPRGVPAAPRLRPLPYLPVVDRPRGREPRGLRALPLGRAPDGLRPAGGELRRASANWPTSTACGFRSRPTTDALRRHDLRRPGRRADGRVLVGASTRPIVASRCRRRPTSTANGSSAPKPYATDGEKWLHHPASIKALGDWAFCRHQPSSSIATPCSPGRTATPGMSMEDEAVDARAKGPIAQGLDRARMTQPHSSSSVQVNASCPGCVCRRCGPPTTFPCRGRN